jgi:hypothetical protein
LLLPPAHFPVHDNLVSAPLSHVMTIVPWDRYWICYKTLEKWELIRRQKNKMRSFLFHLQLVLYVFSTLIWVQSCVQNNLEKITNLKKNLNPISLTITELKEKLGRNHGSLDWESFWKQNHPHKKNSAKCNEECSGWVGDQVEQY